VHQRAAQVVDRVRGGGLGRRLREPVDRGHDLLVLVAVERADVDGPGDPPVVPLLDRPHPPGPHDPQQPGVDQQVHVVGDRALGPVNRQRHFGDGGGPFEQQVKQRAAQRVGQRPQLPGRGDHDHLFEVVVRDLLDRHKPTILRS
jgi:hypothetical protein